MGKGRDWLSEIPRTGPASIKREGEAEEERTSQQHSSEQKRNRIDTGEPWGIIISKQGLKSTAKSEFLCKTGHQVVMKLLTEDYSETWKQEHCKLSLARMKEACIKFLYLMKLQPSVNSNPHHLAVSEAITQILLKKTQHWMLQHCWFTYILK